MRKIRILTFWGVPNHGCFLQAYALQKIVEDLCPGDDVRQISYLGEKHYNFYYNNPFMLRKIFRFFQEQKLKMYIKNYDVIPHVSNKSITVFPDEEIDALILGSDIIWDYNSDVINGDRYLFGGGINAKKKISYAASFGRGKTDVPTPNYVGECLNELSAISVRDSSSAELVQSLTGIMPQNVLDPTLLYDFSNDARIIKPNNKSKFIVVYGSDFTEEQIIQLKSFAREKSLQIINLEFMGKRYCWCDFTIGRDKLSPFEWLGYFKHAEYIMTSTYHGLIFGLIFEKRIVFNPTDFIVKKASRLIRDLEIESSLLNNVDFRKADELWNYSKINEKLSQMREQSIQYLKCNLL